MNWAVRFTSDYDADESWHDWPVVGSRFKEPGAPGDGP